MELISTFNLVRDIPYNIALEWGKEDNCCTGKHEKLLNLLKEKRCEARYRVCLFLWESLNLPPKLINISHEKDCTHTYLEIKLNGKWIIIDATWDSGLSNLFHVNQWDGKTNTKIAVNPIETFNPKKSLEIVNNQDKKEIEKDLKINKNFYRAFNDWLEENRIKTNY